MRTFEWDESKEYAARLCAERCMSYAAVAEAVGVSHDTITRWRKRPEFQDRLVELSQEFSDDREADVNSGRAATMKRSGDVVEGYWDVATSDRSGQARVAALNSLARIAGLLGRGGAGTLDLDVAVTNNVRLPSNVPEIESSYEISLRDNPVGRRDVE